MKQVLLPKKIIRSLFLSLFMLLGTQISWGQVTIAKQDFEVTPGTPTMTFTTSDSGTVGTSSGFSSGVSGASGTNSPSGVNLFSEGTRGYRIQGPDTGSATVSRTLTFSSINTSAYTNVQFSMRMAGMSLGSSGNGIDTTIDEVLIEVSPDNGTTWYQQAKVNSSVANTRWYFGATGSGSRDYATNNTFSTYSSSANVTSGTASTAITTATITNLPSVANLILRVSAQANSVNESWILDDFKITGTVATYSVTYNSNNATSGTVPTDSSVYSSNASVTTAANSGTLARTGYTFAGWNTAADGSGTTYAVSTTSAFSITANTTLYAKWTANNNTITFDANTGSGTAMSNQTIATAASATLTSNTYTKAGYTFAGWNTLANGTGTSYANGASYTMGTASVTLYAKWTANNNTITFDANTGSGTAMSNQTIATAASATLTSNTYTKTGYTFAGWSTLADGSGTSYANGASYTMGTASVTLYAKWTANNNTITFDANTGSGTVMSNQTIATAATAALSSNTYTKAGYSFAGWATTSSGVVAYANIANYTMGTASVTLYAKWTANNNTITFDANTGSGTMSSQIIATAASASLSTNTYTKTGYDFGGWTTAADGTGTAYIDGANYIMGTTDVTLYAKWTSVALASQTITFNALSPLVYSITPLTLTATASSGLEVSYSSDNINVATVSGSTVTLVGVGSANITASQAGNGSYNGAPSVTQTLTVTPKELIIASASASDKTYDRNTTAVLNGTLSGVINSDAVSLSLSATFNTATAGIGKPVTSTSTLVGTKAGNYTLTQPTGLTANITAKTLTVNGATVTSKSYTGTTAATITGASLVGVISPDAVGVIGGGNFAQASVGTPIAVTTSLTLNGVDAGNYSVSQPTLVTGSITTAPLTINISGLTANKIYDTTTVATITGTPAYVGLQNGETLAVTGTPVASFGTKGIGTAKPITISGYTAPNSNYTLTQQPTGLTGNITVATLTVNGATASSKVYDGLTATTTSGGTFVGVLPNDVVTVTHGVANFVSSTVGTGITVTSAITATGTDGANYIVTQPTLTANITEAPVVLAGWQFGTPASSGSEVTYNATTNNANLSTVTLSRGAGVAATGLARGFSATTWDVGATKANAITNNEYFQFVMNASSGYNFSLFTLDATLRRTSTAPNAFIWKYSTDGTNFTEIGSDISFTSTADGVPQSQISLSNIPALQNAKSITFRIYAWGDITNNTGTFAFARYAANITTNCLALGGNVYADLTPPTLTSDTTSNTVDNNNDITFTDDATWRTKISAVKIGTTVLTPTTDYVITSGTITLKPSGGNTALTTAGSKAVTVIASGYTNATVSQVINAGVPTANSTAAISAILAPNETRTITCTALDKYFNLVSGYTFKFDATVTNAIATTLESYTINGNAITTTTNNVDLSTSTNSSGVVQFTTLIPSSVDSNDGVNLQVQLNDGTTNIGSAFAYHQLPGQTITFGILSNVTYGDGTYTISATGGASGNAVVFSSSDPLIATCSGDNGSTITVVGPGTCTIYANQAGSSTHNAAAQVSQLLTVDKKALTIVGAAAQNKVYNNNATATITGTLSPAIGLDVVTLTLNGTFADANAGSGIAVTSTSTLGGANAGKYTLTQPLGLTANITQVATNTIFTFGTITNKVIGQTFTLAATSTSGLPVTYDSSNRAVATISGNTVTSVGIGTTTITASQAGNVNYVAASSLTQELKVTAVPIAAWDFNSVTTAVATFAATTFDTNLETASNANTITRGATAASNSAASSFRTAGFKNGGITPTNMNYFQVTLAPVTGKSASLSTINANFAGTASFYASPGVSSQYAYSLDGTNFTLIGSPQTITSTTINPTEIDLTGIADLQNVPSGTTITLRYFASGQTTTGGWGFYSATAGTNGLSIGGAIVTTPPTVNAQAFCNAALVSQLVATGTGIKWYANATSGFVLDPSTSLSTRTYYVTQTIGGVESARTPVDVTINTTPAPTASAQTFCNSALVSDLVATGTDLKWYSDLTGVTALSTSVSLTTNTFYVSQIANSCEGSRRAVVVTINTNPTSGGTIAGEQTLCTPANPATFTSDVLPSGQTGVLQYQWQSSIDNVTFSDIASATSSTYNAPSGLTVTTYYKRLSRVSCQSNWTGAAESNVITVTVNPIVNPTFTQVSPICLGTTLTALPTTSTNSITGVWSPALNNAATTQYSFTSDSGQCAINTTMTITVNHSVSGTVSADQIIVTGTQPANITLTGSVGNIQWQSSSNNSSYTNIVGATNATLTSTEMGTLTAKKYYRAVVTIGSCTPANSGVVTVNVTTATKIQASQAGGRLPDLNTVIVADWFSSSVSQYRFKVVNGTTTRTIETPNRGFSLSSLSGGGAYNTTYTISVAVRVNNNWGIYGVESLVSTPIIPPATKVIDTQCGTTLPDLYTVIVATWISGVTNYKFEVVNGATTRYIETTNRGFSLSSLVGGGTYNTTYTIRVATKAAGLDWGAYGAPCDVTTPTVPPATKIIDTQCGMVLPTLNTVIVATWISGVSGYRFEVVNGTTTRIIDTPNRGFSLSSLLGGGAYSTTYTIRVATKYFDVSTNQMVWGEYGTSCNVSTPSDPNTARAIVGKAIVTNVVSVKVYPNPFTTNFKLDFSSSSESNVEIVVYDMIGRQLERLQVGSSEMNNLELGNNYPSGVYNVIVKQGEEVKTLRVIKR